MTLVLNILHKDFSILAADTKAIAEWHGSAMSFTTVPVARGQVVYGFRKLVTNRSKMLAVGIAGRTQDHEYINEIQKIEEVDECLRLIRSHIDRLVPAYNRALLSTLTSYNVNEGIASFFDRSTSTYYTNRYLFSPIELQTRIHRGAEEVKVLSAGSGSRYFVRDVGFEEVAEFIRSAKGSCTPDVYISWIKDAYERVSKRDSDTGGEPVFLLSTRSKPAFQTI